jgi:serine/threonine protein kinase
MASMSQPTFGDTIAGRYQILSQLGVGGFGAVYKGRDERMARDVALKMLLPHLAAMDGISNRFIQEATLINKLTSPHTIRIYDYGSTDEGALYIAMELLHGCELEDVLQKKGPIPPDQVVQITLEVLDSLAEAHRHSIVHRDLKPSNIFLSEMGRRKDFVKVLDFGIAKLLDDAPDSDVESSGPVKKLTATGQTLGTPYYMAPEQIRQGRINPNTDIYALGLIVIEMLTGQVAVGQHSHSPIEIVMIHANADPIPMPAWIESSALGPIIRRAVEKDTSLRYQRAEEMIADLEKVDISGIIPPADPSRVERNLDFADTGQIPGGESRKTGSLDTTQASTPSAIAAKGRGTSGDTAISPPPIFDAPSLSTAETEFLSANTQPQNKKPIYITIGLLTVLLLVGVVLLVLKFSNQTPESATANNTSNNTSPTQTPPTSPPDPPPVTQQPIAATQPPPVTQAPPPPLPAPRTVRIILDSQPPGATVKRGEATVGTTPFDLELQASDKLENWSVELDGFNPESFKINLEMGTNTTLALKAIAPPTPPPIPTPDPPIDLTKPEDPKITDTTKPEDPTKKPGDKKPGDKKPGDKKPGDKKPGDKKPDGPTASTDPPKVDPPKVDPPPPDPPKDDKPKGVIAVD